MKTSRIVAAGTAFLIAGAGILAGGAAAQADDFYLVASQLTATETNPYSAGWFQGNVTGTKGTITSGPAGLTATGGQFQLLNGSPGGTDLLTLGQSAEILSTDANPSFQIPIYAGPGATNFTTIFADAAGIAANQWFSSSNLSVAFPTLTPGVTHTLEEYDTAFAGAEQVLAFGFNKNIGETATIASLKWNGDTYWFLPTPTVALSPTTVTPAASSSTGITITAAGFIPGEAIDLGFSTGGSGGSFGTTTADVNGAISARFVAPAALAVGSYTLSARGAASDAVVFANFAVAAAAAPALAATGTDTIVPVVAGGVLLLGGALALMLVARRRQADAI